MASSIYHIFSPRALVQLLGGDLLWSYLLYCNLLCHAILQALPYMRYIRESWPMTKAYFKAVALRELGRLRPEHVPEVYHLIILCL